MKIVLDTNVLIAALIARHGACAALLEHCVDHHELVTSEFILGELSRHLLGKFKYSPEDTEATISLLTSQMEMVQPLPLDSPVCRDPEDDAVLATALAGEADCIVTGDKDLLVIGRFRTIDIIKPADFAAYETLGDNPA